ncbi:MAG TPA: hypothetical protein VNH44_15665 [Micropepsaceae bacterium]|nr:hypothetical protein [Micropepsaceae bacterium]
MAPLSAEAAAPIGIVGAFSGDYSNSSYSGGGSHADTWGLNGAGAFGLGMNDLAGQINGGYHRLSVSGADADIWDIGGSAYWAPGFGRAGASVAYTTANFGGSGSGIDAHATTYGVFGEYFLNDAITVGAKGGGADGKVNLSGFGSGSGSGGYVGGELTGYAMPDLALKGTIDYVDLSGGHLTSYGINAEYLFSEATPISLYGGYVRSDLSNNAGHVDTWMVGLKFYTGGPGSLVTHQRTETLGSIGTNSALRSAL